MKVNCHGRTALLQVRRTKHLQKRRLALKRLTNEETVKDIPSGKVDNKHMDRGFKSSIIEWQRM